MNSKLFEITQSEAKALLVVLENEFISYEHEVAINLLRRLQQFVRSDNE